jgi:hypothetical protein
VVVVLLIEEFGGTKFISVENVINKTWQSGGELIGAGKKNLGLLWNIAVSWQLSSV